MISVPGVLHWQYKNGNLTGIFIPTKTKLFIFTRYQSSKIDIINHTKFKSS